jgi:hypothetical protein
MMFKVRVALLGVLALVITSGIAVSAASAAGPIWKVNGSRLTQGEKQVKIKAGVTELKGTVSGTAVVINCTTATIPGAFIMGNGTGAGQDKSNGITFENCKVAKPTTCETSKQIKTNQTKSHLVTYTSGELKKIGDLFEPTVGTEFAGLLLTGASCFVHQEIFPIKGTVASEVKPENAEAVKGELVFPPTAITKVVSEGQEVNVLLSIGAATNVATFNGNFEAELFTAEKFGAFK